MTDASTTPLLLLALQLPGHGKIRDGLWALEKKVVESFTVDDAADGALYLGYLKAIDVAATTAGLGTFSDPKLTAGYEKMAALWAEDRTKFDAWHRKLQELRQQKWEACGAS